MNSNLKSLRDDDFVDVESIMLEQMRPPEVKVAQLGLTLTLRSRLPRMRGQRAILVFENVTGLRMTQGERSVIQILGLDIRETSDQWEASSYEVTDTEGGVISFRCARWRREAA